VRINEWMDGWIEITYLSRVCTQCRTEWWTHLCDATTHVFGTPSGKLGREIGPHSCSTFSGIVHVSNWPACSDRMHGPRRGGSTDTLNATLGCPSRLAGSAAGRPAGDDWSPTSCSSGSRDTVCENWQPLADVDSTTYTDKTPNALCIIYARIGPASLGGRAAEEFICHEKNIHMYINVKDRRAARKEYSIVLAAHDN